MLENNEGFSDIDKQLLDDDKFSASITAQK